MLVAFLNTMNNYFHPFTIFTIVFLTVASARKPDFPVLLSLCSIMCIIHIINCNFLRAKRETLSWISSCLLRLIWNHMTYADLLLAAEMFVHLGDFPSRGREDLLQFTKILKQGCLFFPQQVRITWLDILCSKGWDWPCGSVVTLH